VVDERGIEVRVATAGDEPFLREMLFLAPFVPPGTDPAPRLDRDDPALTHYVDGYGRAGDLGVIAGKGDTDVGAAWVRLLIGDDAGYGYVDDVTPELTIAVMSEWRGRGVGTRLLEELLARTASEFPAVALSCDPANPAMRIYERLGFVAVGVSGTSITMVRPS
jgi:GNAT superfamily N-acetyltransferase